MSNTSGTELATSVGLRRHKSLIIGFVVWVFALVALLNLRLLSLPLSVDHLLCGRWGCAPPMMTVLGWHGFLLVALFGPMKLASGYLTSVVVRRAGCAAAVLGLCLAVATIALQSQSWNGSVQGPFDFVRASLQAIASRTDVPALQLAVIGLGFWKRGATSA